MERRYTGPCHSLGRKSLRWNCSRRREGVTSIPGTSMTSTSKGFVVVSLILRERDFSKGLVELLRLF